MSKIIILVFMHQNAVRTAQYKVPCTELMGLFFAEADSTLRDVKAQKANQIRVH